MSNALTPTTDAMPAALAAPLKQAGSFLAQPAVKRALPLLLLLGLIASAALAWMMLATSPQRILFAQLTDSDKASITASLDQAGIKNGLDSSGALTVSEDDYHKARMLLASQNLPKAAPGGYAILDQLPMGVSRAVEGERLRQARETELAKSIQEIDSVAEARVHLAMPENSVFVRDNASPSASVIIRLQTGRTLSEAQVRSVVNLVASSVPGMKPDAVTIVDQMGTLLNKESNGADGGSALGDERIDFQRRVEDKVRTQVVQLLTPLLGAGNFTTEVQANVDLDESQATRESYAKDGAMLRAEQGNWTGTQKDGQAPGGIPGALSNTPPAAATLSAPNAQAQAQAQAPAAPGANGQPAAPAPVVSTPGYTPPAAGASAGGPAGAKASENYARTYDLGKEVSVTRASPGNIKRLSVAVLLREEPGKPRGKVEIQQITQLVQAAVGFDPSRQDQVMVISRKFSPSPAPELQATTPWYDNSWLPVILRNVTAVIIALMVLILGVRPLAKALLKKREEPAGNRLALAGQLAGGDAAGGVGAIGGTAAGMAMLDRAAVGGGVASYEDRVSLVKGFTHENPARAAAAVRDMIRADGQ